jgi:DNA invertase Pin-like site-specific DNA recombinase
MTQDHPRAGTRAYSYVRMSTHKQLSGDSLRRQLEKSRAFANEHGLRLDESLSDIGVSAWKGKNARSGALGVFLQMVEHGEIAEGSYLLIESLDRLSREAVPDALTLFMAIINAGIIIATLGDDRQIYSRDRLKGDWTKLIIGLAVMSRGHEESRTKSERIRAVNQHKREQARAGKGQMTARTPAWINAVRHERNRYSFTLNSHAATVKMIFELASQGLGSTAIAKALNTQKIPAFKSSDGWHQSVIKALLVRRDVIGEFQPHRLVDGRRVADGDPIVDYFPEAIDRALFSKVQSIRKLSGNPGRKGKTFGNLLTGLCSCAHCGGSMSLKHNRLKAGMVGYLACNNHVRGQRCKDGGRNFRYDALEDAILDHVRELEMSDALKLRQSSAEIKAIDDRLAALTDAADGLQGKEQRLMAALENDGDAVDAIVHRLKERQAERQALRTEIETLRQQRTDLIRKLDAPERQADLLKRLRQQWRAEADDQIRYRLRAQAHTAIRELVQDIVFDSLDNTVTLIIADGVIAYRFAEGKLTGHYRIMGYMPPRKRAA